MKKLAVFSIVLLTAVYVHAQDLSALRVQYEISYPLGQFKSDYMRQTSWRGISFDSRWEVAENITVGFKLGWNVFAQRFDNTIEVLGNGRTTIHGTQFRFVNTYPMQANAHYYFGEEYRIRPWTGLAIGTAYTDQRTQVGFSEIQWDSWSFALTPQAGIDIPLNSDNASFTFNVSYNYFSQNTVSFDYSFLTLGFGFKFAFH